MYQVVNQLLGILGANGLDLASQSLSIMSILLFAATIDYSLFVFSRYREELKNYETKFDAMKYAMRETGIPVFFAGGTVLAQCLYYSLRHLEIIVISHQFSVQLCLSLCLPLSH